MSGLRSPSAIELAAWEIAVRRFLISIWDHSAIATTQSSSVIVQIRNVALAVPTPSPRLLASMFEIVCNTITISALTTTSSATTASRIRIRVDASRLTLGVRSTSVMPEEVG